MTFAIPTRVRIRGRWWMVYQEPNLPAWAKRGARGKTMRQRGVVGLTWRKQREIHLARGLKGEALRSTFLHELMHAAVSNELPDDAEECMIRDIETPLLRVLEQLKWR